MNATSTAGYASRRGGRIAYEIIGDGSLVVLVPGMGDLRSAYRFLAPEVARAGYRAACIDLRGHGDSDATFDSYGDVETAGDITAVIEELHGPAVIVGNSMGAGAAALVAAQRPELVSGLVLIGPFVRDPQVGVTKRVLLRVLMARPWAAMSWKAYLPRLYAGRRPIDFDEHRAQVVASIRRPGYARSFSLTTRASHATVEARLGDVAAPALVVMGEKDPDFPNPREEADWIARALQADVFMVPEAGHYPQSQCPNVTAEAVLRFLGTVSGRVRGAAPPASSSSTASAGTSATS